MTQRAHGEGVTSLGKEMDFCWNACLVQRSRIDGAVANRIDRIVPSLKKKCRRGHLGDFDSRIKRAPRSAQVAREHCDGKIGPAAHFVYFVDWLIGRFDYFAGLRDQDRKSVVKGKSVSERLDLGG